MLSLDGLTSSPHCRKNAYSPLGLQQGYIVRHYMGGSLPDCVWHMPNLTVLHVAGNGLSGTLPNDLRSDTKLLNVSIAYNRFSGTIPDILQNFPFIELCLAYNKLSGALSSTAHTTKNYGIYTGNSNVLPAGSIVSVEVNRLTGYTPLDFVKVGTLFALNGNFFDCDGQHPLPRNDEQSGYYICGSKNLDQSLAAWAVVSSLIFVFVGIVAIVQWNKRSLSHKETSSQMMSIEEEDDIASDADSMLTQELIPEHSYSLCTSPGSFDADDNLPENQLLHSRCSQNKPKRDLNYFTCSEQTKIFSASMWAYITSCVTLWILWFEISLREETDANKDLTPSKNGCISLSESACRLKDLKVFVSLLCMIRRSALLVTGIIILFCAPFYLLMKLVWGNQYSTHQYQYGWLVSSAFLSGIVPAVCLLLLFLILCCVLAYSLVMLYPSAVRDAMHHVRLSMLSYHRDSNHINLAYAGTTKNGSNCLSSFGSPDNSLSQNSIYTLLQGGSNTAFSQRPLLTKIGTKQFLAFSALFLLDVVITLSVNGLYVYGFDTSTHYYVKVFMKVVLALFQITWNLIVVPKTVEYVARVVHDKSSRVKWLMTLCLSFNYIIAPAMAGLLSSSTCFADYFKEQPSVVSFYEYDICRAYSLDVTTNLRSCNELTTAAFSTSFIPPFMYYYQCSSTLITSYVPILMLEHAIIVVVPICLVVALSHKHSANYVPDFFIRVIPSVVWPPQHRPAMTDLASYSGAIMRPDRMIAAFMSHFVVLITYGLANPFLAVAICIAMCTLTVLAQILIGRYICYYLEINNRQVQDFDNGDSAKAYRTPLDTLNSMCAGILDGLPSCLWTILLIGSLFMSAIFSDMASDQVSWQVGIVVGIPAFSAPFLAYGTLKLTLYSSYWSHNAQ